MQVQVLDLIRNRFVSRFCPLKGSCQRPPSNLKRNCTFYPITTKIQHLISSFFNPKESPSNITSWRFCNSKSTAMRSEWIPLIKKWQNLTDSHFGEPLLQLKEVFYKVRFFQHLKTFTVIKLKPEYKTLI